jgi:chaperonin GroEL
VLAPLAFLWALRVDRERPGKPLARVAPLLAITAAWAVLHPRLIGRLWGPYTQSIETETRPPLPVIALKAVLALVSLDEMPAPESGLRQALLRGLPGAIALAGIVALGLWADRQARPRGARRVAEDPGRTTSSGIITFAIGWGILGSIAVLMPSINWHAYYGLFGAFGVWLAIMYGLRHRPAFAVAIIAVLTVLRPLRADTPSWDWASEAYQRRAGYFLRTLRDDLLRKHPDVPAHSRFYFAEVPRNIGWVAGDGPALRVWYRDSTLTGGYYSYYRPRRPDQAPGPDYFLRFDSSGTWVEVAKGEENVRTARARNRGWEQDHRELALLLGGAGDWNGAAEELVKLADESPENFEYPLNAAVCYEKLGDSLVAARLYARAAALPALRPRRRRRPRVTSGSCRRRLQRRGRMGKRIQFDDDARAALRRGVEQLAGVVRVTLGPRGRNVVIEHGGGSPTITNDGLAISREIELADRFENMGAQLVKEVALKTGEVAGDGTTTATVLAHAIVTRGLQAIAAGHGPMQIRRGIERAVAAVVESLRAQSRPLAGRSDIARIATVSAQGEDAVGELIAQAIDRVGRHGVITVEEGRGLDTTLEVVEGLRFDRGYLSPYFVTEPDTMEVTFENSLILLAEQKFSAAHDLLPALEHAARAGRPLLVVADDVEGEALAMMVVNRLRSTVQSVAVKAPASGDRRREQLDDLAVLTGATLFTSELGRSIGKIEPRDFGRAKRVRVDREATTLLEGGGRAPEIRARIARVGRELEVSDSDHEREWLRERLGKLSSGVAVIRVGAPTAVALLERKARVEDALAATRAAVEEGVVPGGGVGAAARAGIGARARRRRRRGGGARHRRRRAREPRAPDRAERRLRWRGGGGAHPARERQHRLQRVELRIRGPRRRRRARSHQGHARRAPERVQHRRPGAHHRRDRGGQRRGRGRGPARGVAARGSRVSPRGVGARGDARRRRRRFSAASRARSGIISPSTEGRTRARRPGPSAGPRPPSPPGGCHDPIARTSRLGRRPIARAPRRCAAAPAATLRPQRIRRHHADPGRRDRDRHPRRARLGMRRSRPRRCSRRHGADGPGARAQRDRRRGA